MKNIGLVVGTLLGVMALLAVAPLLTVLSGMFAGWVVNYFFPVTTSEILGALGITLPLWKVGAGLGFVSAFVKSSSSSSK